MRTAVQNYPAVRTAVMKYFDVETVINQVPDAHIYMFIGERSNGKTYSALRYGIKQYVENGKRFVYVRRLAEMIRMVYMRNLFTGNKKTGDLYKQLNQLGYDDLSYYAGAFWGMHYNEKRKLERIDDPIGYTSAISTWETSKGGYLPDLGTVIFDEFLTRGTYLPNEPVLFENLISSLVRTEDNAKVLMLANTVSWNAPYFREWGLNHVKDMRQGTFDVYNSGDGKRKIVVCYTEHTGPKKSDVYFNYDNPRSRMITEGVWETADYPKIPEDISEWIQGIPSYVQSADGWTIKLVPVALPDGMECLLVFDNNRKLIDENGVDKRYRNRLIYTDIFYPYANCKLAITKHNDDMTKFILTALKQGRVFYQNNTVGEYMRNYLIFSQKYSPIPS